LVMQREELGEQEDRKANGWRYLHQTLVRRAVPAWGKGASQDYAVIVYCVEGMIVAAIDERVKEHEEWEALVDWGSGVTTPACATWRSQAFGFVSPVAT
jgi:hypothetical protein